MRIHHSSDMRLTVAGSTYGYRSFDRWVMTIVNDFEVIVRVAEQVFGLVFEHQLGKRISVSRQLSFDLFDVVAVDVTVPACPDELTDL